MKEDSQSPRPPPKLVQMELGQVDVPGRLHQIDTESKKIIADAEKEVFRREGGDIGPILKPISAFTDSAFTSSVAQMDLQSLLDGNVQDFEYVHNQIKSKIQIKSEAGTQLPLEDQDKIALERVRRRLLHLVSKAPPAEFVQNNQNAARPQTMISATRGFSNQQRSLPAFTKRPGLPQGYNTSPGPNMPGNYQTPGMHPTHNMHQGSTMHQRSPQMASPGQAMPARPSSFRPFNVLPKK